MSTISNVKDTGEMILVGLGIVAVGVGIYFVVKFLKDPLAAIDGGAQVVNRGARSATEAVQHLSGGVVNTDWGQINTLGSTQDDFESVRRTNSTKLGNVVKLGQTLLNASPMGIGAAVSVATGVSNRVRQGADRAVAMRAGHTENKERDTIIEHNTKELEKFNKHPRKYEPNFILIDSDPFQTKYMDQNQIDAIKIMSSHTITKFHFMPVSTKNMEVFGQACDLYHGYKQLLLQGMFLEDIDKKVCDMGTDAFFKSLQKLVHPNAPTSTRKRVAATKDFLERHGLFKSLQIA